MAAPISRNLTVSRQAMACTFCLVFPGGVRHGVEAGCAALDEVERLEEKLSAYRPESDISRVNRIGSPGPVSVDAETFAVLEIAARIHAETGGAFDAAAGALSRAWGFHTGPRRVPAERARLDALAASGMRLVELDRARHAVRLARAGVEVNLGAIGKGYTIDVALGRIGVRSVLMHGGQSSMRAIGAPPGEPEGWKVGIGDPYRPGHTICTVRLRDRALGTSGAMFQSFVEGGRRYGHILDARTGWPAARVASATALAPTAAEADALSTAFYVMSVEGTREYVRSHTGVAALLVTGQAEAPVLLAIGDIAYEQSHEGVLRAAPHRNRLALPLRRFVEA